MYFSVFLLVVSILTLVNAQADEYTQGTILDPRGGGLPRRYFGGNYLTSAYRNLDPQLNIEFNYFSVHSGCKLPTV